MLSIEKKQRLPPIYTIEDKRQWESGKYLIKSRNHLPEFLPDDYR